MHIYAVLHNLKIEQVDSLIALKKKKKEVLSLFLNLVL